ncbi:hypothetical protein RTM1035_02170 [Roseovarius sp. TM1035]|jgi:hypothetical protein|uniref:hypothetical protein n=1 Tax=Roseovarius sp. TM1035 TaxID=391613 RepID=UPI00015567BA|nr:hypothetical protein [Roseovarius sp. TM1035]EDM31257.1 hypothetical protein RTM1035_02170 [Roseovarius sp. TM1035]
MSDHVKLSYDEYQKFSLGLENLLKTIIKIDEIVLPRSIDETALNEMDGLVIHLREEAKTLLQDFNAKRHVR